MGSSENLVGDLVRELEPVRPIPKLRTVAGAALGIGVLVSGLVFAVRGLRPDLMMGALQPVAILIGLGLTAVACGGIVASIGAGVPGRENVARTGLLALVSGLALSAGAAGWGLFSSGAAAWGGGLEMRCLLTASGVGLLPTVGLLLFLVHALPRHPAASLATAAGGAVGIGGLAAHASCASTGGLHLLIEHALAPVLGGLLLAILLYPVLRRLSRVSRG
jgi:hypothetical protein